MKDRFCKGSTTVPIDFARGFAADSDTIRRAAHPLKEPLPEVFHEHQVID